MSFLMIKPEDYFVQPTQGDAPEIHENDPLATKLNLKKSLGYSKIICKLTKKLIDESQPLEPEVGTWLIEPEEVDLVNDNFWTLTKSSNG